MSSPLGFVVLARRPNPWAQDPWDYWAIGKLYRTESDATTSNAKLSPTGSTRTANPRIGIIANASTTSRPRNRSPCAAEPSSGGRTSARHGPSGSSPSIGKSNRIPIPWNTSCGRLTRGSSDELHIQVSSIVQRNGDQRSGDEMSAWEYWDALERLLSEERYNDVPGKLIEKGWTSAENRAALAELLSDHDGEYGEDDNEWDTYCVCGKWLERDNYEWPDHMSSVLEDSGLLTTGEPWLNTTNGEITERTP